jgi:predicted enzyme related to lactoylglutathione lyase
MTARFVRVELRTTNVAAARAFYRAVLGAEPSELSVVPAEAVARGARPHWLGYLGVDDVERVASAFVERGGTRLGPSRTGPQGAIALLRDPGGAVVALTSAPPIAPLNDVTWQVHNGENVEPTLAAYCDLLGWRRTERMELPGIGVFHRFAFAPGAPDAGAFTDISGLPGRHPHWLFHFRTARFDEAIGAVRSGGGVVLPVVTLPTGRRVAICDDPQGGAFALLEDPR